MLNLQSQDTILILDDDPDILSLLSMELRKNGYAVDTAPDAQTALTFLEKKHYTAAILDIVLGPSSTSESVVRYIQDAPRPSVHKLPLIITSAFLNENIANKIESKGVNVYKAIKKPFKKNQITELLQKLKSDLSDGVFVILNKEEEIIEEEMDKELQVEQENLKKLDGNLVSKEELSKQTRLNQAMLAKKDFNWRNEKGETALMIFAEQGDAIGVNSQLEFKGIINLKSNDGYTALSYACANNHLDIVKKLIESGAKHNIRDNKEKEPLAIAITKKHYLVADYLINQGARVDNVVGGKSYLMIAMDNNDIAIFNRLLAAGVDPHYKNAQGKDIKTLAREQNKKNFQRILNTLML